jgi:hypothetical protein
MRELELDNGHIEILKLVAERNCCEAESLPNVYKDKKRTKPADACEIAERVSELLYPEIALLKLAGDGLIALSDVGKKRLYDLENVKKVTGDYQTMTFALKKAQPLPREEVPILML